uniref:Uncharacterized protein n=1 Tax=Candidatus Kentrum sp. LFY TaxID=2126342 RepID=A0A450UD49_9GAMM|nr:MAG: hypothetical protein BECKLFY1418B_GA0070995_101934 [Candidatus Kentron sp. LFY]VFK17394.1 MAG: hypothetical protein BECKLFY1418C_GA0070996_103127 [Candidatus Kentron sp. LFY]
MDEILRDLWRVNNDIAKESNYSLDTLVSYLRSKSGKTILQEGETKELERTILGEDALKNPTRAATSENPCRNLISPKKRLPT